MNTVDTEAPTHCEVEWCGQKLLIRAPGRTRCERCRLGRTVHPDDRPKVEKKVVERVPVPCLACGETEVEGHPGLLLGMADGYCLGCRVQGKHLS